MENISFISNPCNVCLYKICVFATELQAKLKFFNLFDQEILFFLELFIVFFPI